MTLIKMNARMNYKNVLDNWVGFISGVFGGGMSYTLQIAWHDELLKLSLAAGTAFVAGAMGVAGKYLFVWTWKKIKLFICKK